MSPSPVLGTTTSSWDSGVKALIFVFTSYPHSRCQSNRSRENKKKKVRLFVNPASCSICSQATTPPSCTEPAGLGTGSLRRSQVLPELGRLLHEPASCHANASLVEPASRWGLTRGWAEPNGARDLPPPREPGLESVCQVGSRLSSGDTGSTAGRANSAGWIGWAIVKQSGLEDGVLRGRG